MKKGVVLTFAVFLMFFMIGCVSATDMKKTEITDKEFNEIVNNDPEYIKTKEYAGFLGYETRNIFSTLSEETVKKAVKLDFPDGQFLYEPLSSEKNSSVSIAWLKKNNATYSFIIKQEIVDNELIVTFFNEEGGIKINTNNNTVIDKWATHHSCNYWTCVWNGIEEVSWWDLLLCGFSCADCVVTLFTETAGCSACVECLIDKGWDTLGMCAIDNCYTYPCKTDCSEKNVNNYSYYCSGGNVWRKKTYNAFKCPDSISYSQSGTCQIDIPNTKTTENSVFKNCQYGCENGNCTGNSSPPPENYTAKILELEKKLEEQETEIASLKDWKESVGSLMSNILNSVSQIWIKVTNHTAKIDELENKSRGTKSDEYLEHLSSSERKNIICGYSEEKHLSSLTDLGWNCTITYRQTSRGEKATCRCKAI